MSANSRLAVATHIVTLLAAKEREFVCSDHIAKSVCTNPVVIRRLIARLAKAGIVESKLGKCGGARLARGSNKITLRDIYCAVDDPPFSQPSKPENKHCAVSCLMRRTIAEVFSETERLLERKLGKTTIADLVAQLR